MLGLHSGSVLVHRETLATRNIGWTTGSFSDAVAIKADLLERLFLLKALSLPSSVFPSPLRPSLQELQVEM